MVLGDMLRKHVRVQPKTRAFVLGDAVYTYQELDSRVNRLVNALLALGVGKGDRIAIMADNCVEHADVYWAAAKSGTMLAPLNCGLPVEGLRYILENSEASTLVVGQNYLNVIEPVRHGLEHLVNLIVIGPPEGDYKGYDELVSACSAEDPYLPVDEGDVVDLAYTSGTTGLPKGAMLTHRNMVTNAANAMILFGMMPGDVFYYPGPAFSAAFPMFMTPVVTMGCSFILGERYEARLALDTISRERVNGTFLFPPMIMDLLECPDVAQYDISSLRYLIYAGAPLHREVLKRAYGVFGHVFVQPYGLTEAMMSTFLTKEDHVWEGPEEKVRRLSSCGRAAPLAEVRVVDENDRDVRPGEFGEIIIRGDHVMKGYWKLPAATAETIKGDWLYSGDLATVDEEGYIYISDRKKDTISSGGKTVFPREVEEVIFRHGAVAEAAVVGVSDEQLGQAVAAFIVLREGAQPAPGDIIQLCRESLPDYAVPKRVEFVDKLPRNPTGKVLRRLLAQS